MEYFATIAVFVSVLDVLASQNECFIGLFSFRRAEYEDIGFSNVYFKANRFTEGCQLE